MSQVRYYPHQFGWSAIFERVPVYPHGLHAAMDDQDHITRDQTVPTFEDDLGSCPDPGSGATSSPCVAGRLLPCQDGHPHYHIAPDSALTLGRCKDLPAQNRWADPRMSSRHCTFEARQETLWLTDSSSNGVLVNSVRCGAVRCGSMWCSAVLCGAVMFRIPLSDSIYSCIFPSTHGACCALRTSLQFSLSGLMSLPWHPQPCSIVGSYLCVAF